MTFFSLIALALGMMAAADAAAPRPGFAAIAVARDARSSRRRIAGVGAVRVHARSSRQRTTFVRTSPLRRVVAPLTGAATPRAPEV